MVESNITSNEVMFLRLLKSSTHLGFNAIKMLKKISLALLAQIET